MKFSGQLKYQRSLRGWSQARVADELGTTPNTVSTWERGLALPSPYFREKLCQLLQMDAQELGLLPDTELSEELHESVLLAEPALVSVPVSSVAQDMLSTEIEPLQEVEAPQESVPLTHAKRETVLQVWRQAHPRLFMVALIVLALTIASLGTVLFQTLFAPATTSPYPSFTGTLVLNDALKDQSQHVNWQEGQNENRASCQFTGGAYHAALPLLGYFHACIAQATDYKNFVYQVEMTIDAGDYGGIIFRARDSADYNFYAFRVYADGNYRLIRYVDRLDDQALILAQGTIATFHSGLHQKNLLAVVAQDDALSLYVNQKLVVAVHDTSYDHGQIGVFAGSEQHAPAEAHFNNARVWK